MPWDLCFTVDGKFLLAGCKTGDIEVFDMEKLELHKVIRAHKTPVPYVSLSGDGKYIVSVSKTETIIWDAKTLESIVLIDEIFSLACYRHRLLVAILHDGLYKKFQPKLLREFSDEIPEEKESN